MRRAALPLCALVLALPAVLGGCDTDRRPAAPTAKSPVEHRVILGTAAQTRQEVEQRESETGRRLPGMRVFRRWGQPLIDTNLQWARDNGRTVFLSVKSRRPDGTLVAWREIADAVPGSSLYQDLLNQAYELKQYGAPVFFVFNHEPEARPSAGMGTSADYVAAWIRLVATLRAVGASNVRYVWTLTNIGFSRNGGRDAEAFYPGDAYVDAIAIDAYNWFTCLGPANGWLSMAELIEPHRQFGLRHPGKQLMVLEWSSAEDRSQPGRKAAWLREAAAVFRQPGYAAYTALLHWDDRNAQNASTVPCDLDYRSSDSALAAWREMAAGTPYRAG